MKQNYHFWIFTLFAFLIGFSAVHAQEGTIQLKVLDTFEAFNRGYDEGAAEIPAYDPGSGIVFITNAQDDRIDAVKILADGSFEYVDSWDLAAAWPESGGPNSVAVYNGLVAVAVENDDKQANGAVIFFDLGGNVVEIVEVGPLPDMLTFTKDGSKVLVANEGEPNDDYTVDPEGSISIINVSDFSVMTADFSAYTDRDALNAQGIRVFGPNATPAQDFEPEYIALTDDGLTAYAILQENNALAVIDVASATVNAVLPLGYKDHMLPGNKLDASNRDGGINITNWPVKGMYMPDAIVSYTAANGKTYLVTANEGDARDYDGFSEEARVGDDEIVLDPDAFPNADELKQNENLGRLLITNTMGDTDGDGDFDELYSYGGRSFSIWASDGRLVFDSRFEIEAKIAELLPDHFNSNNDETPSFDARSDDKGPEPEGVAIGSIGDKTYAFIGLERVGGIMVYDITNPWQATYVTYINNRDFTQEFDEDNLANFPNAGDLGPEGLVFIPAADNAAGKDLLVVTNEISGTTTVYSVEQVVPDVSASAEGAFWTSKGTYRPTLWREGRVQFSFSADYNPKAGDVFGTAKVSFKKGPMYFRKSDLESLTVEGNRTILTGFGTVNNEGDYKFMIDYVDSFNDKVRIVIWDQADGSILYDSQYGDPMDAKPTTEVGPFDAFYSRENEPILSEMSAEEFGIEEQSFSVYPNPVQHQVMVALPYSEFDDLATVRIIDLNGRIMVQKEASTGMTNQIDVSSLNQGVYLLEVEYSDHTLIRRIMKN